jgi:hypothetical protein
MGPNRVGDLSPSLVEGSGSNFQKIASTSYLEFRTMYKSTNPVILSVRHICQKASDCTWAIFISEILNCKNAYRQSCSYNIDKQTNKLRGP